MIDIYASSTIGVGYFKTKTYIIMSLQQENTTGNNPDGHSKPNTPVQFLTANSIIGDLVYNKQDEKLGKIDDIMIDIASGKIEYVIMAHGGFLTINEKNFAIPFAQLTVDTERKAFILDRSKEFVEKAPGFDINHWPETNFHKEAEYWSML